LNDLNLIPKKTAEVAGMYLGLGDKKWENLIRLALNHKNGNDEVVRRITENKMATSPIASLIDTYYLL
jgi:hypothetical protein